MDHTSGLLPEGPFLTGGGAGPQAGRKQLRKGTGTKEKTELNLERDLATEYALAQVMSHMSVSLK